MSPAPDARQHEAHPPAPEHTQNCIFCRIAAGEIPAYTVHEDALLKVFLDIRPIRPGHMLIVPNQHFDYYDDLPPELASAIVHLGQRLSKALKAQYGVERVAFMFTGTDVKHVHAHVLPMHEKTDITSPAYIEQDTLTFGLAPQAGANELAGIAKSLQGRLEAP